MITILGLFVALATRVSPLANSDVYVTFRPCVGLPNNWHAQGSVTGAERRGSRFTLRKKGGMYVGVASIPPGSYLLWVAGSGCSDSAVVQSYPDRSRHIFLVGISGATYHWDRLQSITGTLPVDASRVSLVYPEAEVYPGVTRSADGLREVEGNVTGRRYFVGPILPGKSILRIYSDSGQSWIELDPKITKTGPDSLLVRNIASDELRKAAVHWIGENAPKIVITPAPSTPLPRKS